MADNDHKIAAVDRWLADVSSASKRWEAAKAAWRVSEGIAASLREVRDSVDQAPDDLRERIDSAISRNVDNAMAMAKAAEELAGVLGTFFEVVGEVDPPEVGEAWRMRCIGGLTWWECARALHYNRQHLERMSKRAKAAAYDLVPGEYRS